MFQLSVAQKYQAKSAYAAEVFAVAKHKICTFSVLLLLAACSSSVTTTPTPQPAPEPEFQSARGPAPFVHPVPGARISSSFANYVVKSRNRRHHGVDFAAPKGTPVYAASSGVVLNADMGSMSDAFGMAVLIEHGDKLQSLSAHLSRIDVEIGDFVMAGQQIGLVGATGRATGPHLHFELWRNGHPQDPLHYLPAEAKSQRMSAP
jgi:murein DD-endopeptidase MepM/ murein hydrolase activator NlpD